ncbi:MAG: CAP domain-containing protein [Lachnospiraceae bacterium]|nr:CAP domain-containing protein [Lachnospiraceae bacterium]
MKYRRYGKAIAALLLCISTVLSAVAPAYAWDEPAGLRLTGEPSEEAVPEAGRLTGEPLTAEAEGTGAVSAGVSTPSPNEIRAYYKEHGIDLDAPLEYASGKKPDISAYSDAGALSESCLNKALDVLNFIRYVAGIPSDVKLDDTYTHYAQAAAFVNHANKTLSHEPKTAGSKPAGMPEQLWEDGATGASRSNIAWGSWNGYSLPDQIMGYMDDGDEYNIDRVGHRRWILNPTMSRTGFGAVDGGGRGTYGALYAFDRNGSSDCKGVVWPARNMPIELFDASHPWSISMGRELNASGISVTLTRTADRKSWSFGSSASDGDFYVNNDNYEGIVTGSYRLIEKGYDIGKAKFTIRKLDRTYTGTPVTLSEEDFEKAVINGSVELTYGKDYVIDVSSYKNNSRKGTASVDVVGIGSYGGRKTVRFRIKTG